LGRIAGIRVGVNLSVFVIVVILVLGLAAGRLPAIYPGLSLAAYIAAAVVAALLFLGSLLAHELAHSLVARRNGIEVESIVLWLLGGVATLRGGFHSAGTEFRIAVAGPASSFVFALVAFGAFSVAYFVFHAPTVWPVFAIVAGGNLMLALFNLLPGYPLDGGRVLRALLWHRGGELRQATRRVSQFGQLIAGVVVFYGLYMAVFYSAYFMALWSVLVGLFLWDAARAVYRAHGGGGARTVADAMAAPFALEPETLVSRLVDEILPTRQQTAFAVARGGRLHGILTLEDLKKLPRERWHRTRVSEVMRPVAPEFFVAPHVALGRADELMRRNGAGALGVIDDAGQLVGFLQRGRIKRATASE
jgi:Zn-dependent protease